jgi:glycerophosphoryl diester phosphodiesterase
MTVGVHGLISVVLSISFGLLPALAQNKHSVKSNYVSFKTTDDLRQYLHRTSDKKTLISAHRGGTASKFPENCLATFENTLQYLPALLECDVQLSKDGQLVMMHDAELERTTNGQGKLLDKTYEELQQLRLEDGENYLTSYKIPSLAEVLLWAKDKAVLTLDVKKGVPPARIVKAIQQAKAESYVVVITYSIEEVITYHSLLPSLMISATVKNVGDFRRLQASGIPLNQVLAFVGVSEPPPALYQLLHNKGIPCILGTIGNLDQKAAARTTQVYAELVERGADIIATDRPREVAKALSLGF